MDDDSSESSMVVVEWFDEASAASQAAAHLVEGGVGAVIDDGSPSRVGVAVLASDEARARQILGLTEPDEASDDEDLKSFSRPWLVPVVVFAVALLLIPLLAFFIAFKLSGG